MGAATGLAGSAGFQPAGLSTFLFPPPSCTRLAQLPQDGPPFSREGSTGSRPGRCAWATSPHLCQWLLEQMTVEENQRAERLGSGCRPPRRASAPDAPGKRPPRERPSDRRRPTTKRRCRRTQSSQPFSIRRATWRTRSSPRRAPAGGLPRRVRALRPGTAAPGPAQGRCRSLPNPVKHAECHHLRGLATLRFRHPPAAHTAPSGNPPAHRRRIPDNSSPSAPSAVSARWTPCGRKRKPRMRAPAARRAGAIAPLPVETIGIA